MKWDGSHGSSASLHEIVVIFDNSSQASCSNTRNPHLLESSGHSTDNMAVAAALRKAQFLVFLRTFSGWLAVQKYVA